MAQNSQDIWAIFVISIFIDNLSRLAFLVTLLISDNWRKSAPDRNCRKEQFSGLQFFDILGKKFEIIKKNVTFFSSLKLNDKNRLVKNLIK